MTFSRHAVILATTMLSPMVGLPTSGARAAETQTGITLPPGFSATVFADNLGHARQMAFGPDGTLYVNTWSGRYYKSDDTKLGGFLVALKDTSGSGHADKVQRFGETFATGGRGGTGIAVYHDGLYAEINDRIVRYSLKDGVPATTTKPTTVVANLPMSGDHPMHPIAIDAKGDLFIDSGSATNACQGQNRMAQSAGETPCVEKETRGGIWRYEADKENQAFSAAGRFATGLRNGEGLTFDAAGRMYATQHGRDQLYENWPQFYKPDAGHMLPAEEVVELGQGKDYGWPECYFDGLQKKLMLAPEYGGDGKKVGVCAERDAPVAFFPAHWAPNDMKIYGGSMLPTAYKDGAFIAFHGSWNRAPAPQAGYNVVFQPMKDGKASGDWVVFADGFAGAVKEPGRAAFRPTGLAIGPDGALYISDDIHGRIWRVTYKGDLGAGIAAAPGSQSGETASASSEALPPEGIHPDAGKVTVSLPIPPGATKEQVALGGKIFNGQIDNGTCGGCHGSDAGGGPIGPDLTTGKWMWSDGSVAGIRQTIVTGVAKPKEHPGAMPAMGGTQLSDANLDAVAAYVWAVGHQSSKR